MTKKIPLILAPAFVLLAASCNDELTMPDVDTSESMAFNVSLTGSGWQQTRSGAPLRHTQPLVTMQQPDGDTLYLHPVVSDYPDAAAGPASRSNLVTQASEMYPRFYVSAYQYEGTWDAANASTAPNYFQTQTAQSSGSLYVMQPARYWPVSGKMRFVAHAPVADPAFTFYPVDDAGRGPRVHINVSDNVAAQNDLLVSYSEEIACKGADTPARLNFKHALTGIRFVCDKKMPKGIITNITISGVRHEGDFFYNMGDATQSSASDLSIDANFNPWEVYDKTFSLDLNYPITGQDGAQITDGENTFVMLPQTLPDGATVQITFQQVDSQGNPTGQVQQISGSLAGRQWPAGKIVTYKISTSDQMLEVSDPVTFDYLGHIHNADGSIKDYNPVNVASYAGDKNMKWKVQYQDEG